MEICCIYLWIYSFHYFLYYLSIYYLFFLHNESTREVNLTLNEKHNIYCMYKVLICVSVI